MQWYAVASSAKTRTDVEYWMREIDGMVS
jgi:hypothetical protein